MNGLLLALGIAAVLALVLTPLFLPWPQHARWLVAAQSLDPARQLHPASQLREVRIASATRHGNDVEICVVDREAHVPDPMAIVGASLPTDAVATLYRWFATETPLLMQVDAKEGVILHGPTEHVAGLRRQDRRAARIEPRPRYRAAS